MKKVLLAILVTLAIPAIAQAHEIGQGSGFNTGFTHPVLGLDHLLAMLSVGILSAQMGGRAIWSVPLAFVGVMLIGGLMGMNAVPFYSVELGIAISVLVLGIALVAEKKLPTWLAMLSVGFFALFHGHAHGTEMPEIGAPALYALGFVTGTAVIHIVGVFIGVFSKSFSSGPQLLRYVGAGIAGIGFHIIIM
jgi:urease accessory protein